MVLSRFQFTIIAPILGKLARLSLIAVMRCRRTMRDVVQFRGRDLIIVQCGQWRSLSVR